MNTENKAYWIRVLTNDAKIERQRAMRFSNNPTQRKLAIERAKACYAIRADVQQSLTKK